MCAKATEVMSCLFSSRLIVILDVRTVPDESGPERTSHIRAVDVLEDFGSLVCNCTNENFERVIVRRVGQPEYVTEFIACTDCGCMYWRPIPKAALPQSLGVTWIGPEPGAPDPGRRGQRWEPEPTKPETPEQKARFMAAVNRANKAKRRKR